MSFRYYFHIFSVVWLHSDPFAMKSSSRVMGAPVLILADPNMAKIPISLITQVQGSLVDVFERSDSRLWLYIAITWGKSLTIQMPKAIS